jgi:ethanolamine kinase
MAAVSDEYMLPEDYTFSVPIDTKENETNALPNTIKTLLGGEYKDIADFKIVQISGGITNRLYRVQPNLSEKHDKNEKALIPSVIIRIYGDNTELLINRETDVQNFKEMSRLNFGVKLLALFANGRIEEDFYNCITLEPGDLSNPIYSKIIARKLCEMNLLNIANINNDNKEPILFKTLYNWCNVAEQINWGKDFNKQERVEKMSLSNKIRAEIEWLSELLNQTDSPIVFAHNDLLSGNILYRQEDEQLVFVDYEYGGWNYRGFDIGNHFCEYAGFDYSKFEDVYPDKGTQIVFLKAYLEEEYKIKHRGEENLESNCQAFVESDTFDHCVDKMYTEVNRYALASHMFWGIWGIIQAKHSKIDFDFLKYGEERIAAYYISKRKLKEDGLL